jgi:arsenite methyltransferase
VLIYVKDKLGAFESFLRVLKPGGRVSLFEPIAKFSVVHPENSLWGYDVTPVVDLAAKVRSVFTAIQPPGKDPMLNFDERWLMRIAQHAGFRKIHLTFEARYESAGTPSEISVSNWENFINTAGNPRIPTLREAMQQALTPDEIERFTAHLRPLVEGSQGITQYGLAYLWAEKV